MQECNGIAIYYSESGCSLHFSGRQCSESESDLDFSAMKAPKKGIHCAAFPVSVLEVIYENK